MDRISVRRFHETDVDEVYGLIHRAFDSTLLAKVYEKATHDIWTEVYTKEYICGMSKLKHYYVAVLDGKIVGCAAVSPVDSMAYVSAVYIDPLCQGKGVGRALMSHIEQDEICQTTKKIFLNALLTAILFYTKQGYYSEDEIPVIFSDCGVDVVQLVKVLDTSGRKAEEAHA